MENSKLLLFDFRGMATLCAQNFPHPIATQLKNRLRIVADATFDPPIHLLNTADIILEPLTHADDIPLNGQAWQMFSLYGFWVTQHRGHAAVVHFYKGRVSTITIFEDKIRILYRTHRNVAKHLQNLILFCVKTTLGFKEMLYFHGAAFSNREKSILLVGQRGSRKTQLTLSLLHRGWDYLSEDKLILQEGVAHGYQQQVSLSDHHYEALPWLTSRVPDFEKVRKNAYLRTAIRNLARRYIHRRLLPSGDKFLNKGHNYSIVDVFPECVQKKALSPNLIIILCNGNNFSITYLDRAKAIDDITLIQRVSFNEYALLENMLELIDNKPWYKDICLIEKNIPNCPIIKVHLPQDYSIEALCNEVEKCLKSA